MWNIWKNCALYDKSKRLGTHVEHTIRNIFGYRGISDLTPDDLGDHFQNGRHFLLFWHIFLHYTALKLPPFEIKCCHFSYYQLHKATGSSWTCFVMTPASDHPKWPPFSSYITSHSLYLTKIYVMILEADLTCCTHL